MAVDPSIRSTTGTDLPPISLHYKTEGFYRQRILLEKLAGTSPASGGGGGDKRRRQAASRTPQNPLRMLNTLSSVSVRESRIQYLCDPQWFRDTASRGPTTIVAPESQFRTCPTDHDSIGYPRMSTSDESSTTMHRLLHASGSHPIPTPYDPNSDVVSVTYEDLLVLVRVEVAAVARAVDRYDDVSVTHSLLLVVSCVLLVAADQQARLYESIEKRRRLN
ncbi:hypothetical protein F511_26279 [Dorcoceras hygrometricum]|uniref:Uncharacterized protein n=1 Tax=Dorcoceras hygrometricum TaxID=472368 RepID=A0A2Z7C7L6_9LAMI|nr:hypothetical protein F511_26279 [Dorcoceras hygrometricum]